MIFYLAIGVSGLALFFAACYALAFVAVTAIFLVSGLINLIVEALFFTIVTAPVWLARKARRRLTWRETTHGVR
jgi:hypothetical protein